MCSLLRIGIHNAGIVDFIDTHFSGSMNDLLFVQQNAHVRNLSFVVVEKSQVAAAGFLQKTDRLSLRGLLVSVAMQLYIEETKNHLCKTAAVDTEYRAAAPDIGCIQKS
jgi:hypothetical protein